MSGILLDSNQLFSDPWLTGVDASKILSFAWRHGWTLLISDVVLLEARGIFAREVGQALERASTGREDRRAQGHRRLRQLLGDQDPLAVTPETAADAYFDSLKQKGEPFDAIDRLPLPDVSHLYVLDRMFSDLRPYHRSSSKDGYRDLLIWMTLVRYLEDSDDDVHFVTANASDFFTVNGAQPTLHPDLLRDLQLRSIDPARVHCHRSMSDLRSTLDSFVDEAETLRPRFLDVAERLARGLVPQLPLGPLQLAEADSSFSAELHIVEVQQAPQLVHMEIHHIFTPDGAEFIARVFADIDIGLVAPAIHHFKFRLAMRRGEDAPHLVEPHDIGVCFGAGSVERSNARTRWSRPWW